MQRSDARILTTHTGSLPRPAPLVNLYARRAHGEPISETELAAEIEAATRDIVPRQVAAGIDIPNNGEQPREAFFLYVRHRMSGFAGQGTRPPLQDVRAYPDFAALRRRQMEGVTAVSNFEPPEVVDEIRYLDEAAVQRECRDFRRLLEAEAPEVGEAFITAPSPGIIAAAVPNRHYDTEDAYIDALARALGIEYRTIVGEGFVLQLDCPDLGLERHVAFGEEPLGVFLDFVDRVVAAINRAIEGLPREAIRLHVCWGNYEGPHDRDVALEDILPHLLAANVGGFVLPFANPRHGHEYRVLERCPLAEDQILVAGVIDTLTNFVEHPDLVAERLCRIAEVLGDPRRLLAGTDCGFDTSAGMGRVATDVVWAKLAAMAEGAKRASRQLF